MLKRGSVSSSDGSCKGKGMPDLNLETLVKI
jgi:hypothetical protein